MVAPENLLNTARQLAEKIATKSPLTVRQAKAALIAAATMTEDAGLKYEQQAFGVAFSSADRVEGTKAFIEKREPKWQGK